MPQDNISEAEIIRNDTKSMIKLSSDTKTLLKYFQRIILFAETYVSESSKAAVEDMLEQAIEQYLCQCRWLTIGINIGEAKNDLLALTITNHDCRTGKSLIVEVNLNPLSFSCEEDIDKLKVPF